MCDVANENIKFLHKTNKSDLQKGNSLKKENLSTINKRKTQCKMWQLRKTTNLLTRLIVTLVFVAQFLDTALALSDKRLCADENCKEIISFGTGVINYPAGEEGMLSFKINAPIRIKSKSAGKDPSLWGIEVGGREGYAPKRLIRETKIKISEKNLKYIVDVVKRESEVPVLKSSENVVGQVDTIDGSTKTTTTTTKPLDMISVESNEESIVINPVENASSEKPAVATPVLMEMVDGTQIPVMTDNADAIVDNINESDNINNIATQSDDADDDYELGDYDDDEEENLYLNNGEAEIQPKIEPKTLSSSTENGEIKSNDIKDSIHEINNIKIISEKTNKISESNTKPPSRLDDIKYEESETNADSSTQSEIHTKATQITKKGEDLNDATQIGKNETVSDHTVKDASQFSDYEIVTDKIDASIPLNNLPQTFQDATHISENEIQSDKKEENLPLNHLPQSSPDAIEMRESETKPEKIDSSLPLHDLDHTPQEELQIDIQTQQQITEHQTESILKTNELPITNVNLKVPVNVKLIPTPENQQQVPTDTIQILEENTASDNTTEALITASVQESNINVINPNIESLPDTKTVDESNLPVLNQDSLNNEEKLVSHSEQNETQRNEETIETKNIQKTQESTLNLEPTTQTESNLAEQLVTEPATLPQNSPENQKQTAETYPETTTETPSPLQSEIPQASTASPLNLPSLVLESEPHQHSSTETPSSSPDAVLNNDLYQQQIDKVNPTLHHHPSTETPSSLPDAVLNNDLYQQQRDNVNPTLNHHPSTETPSSLNNDLYQQQRDNVNPTPHHHPSTETPSSLNNDLYQQQIDNVNPTPHHHPSTETPSSLPDAVLSNDPYQQQIDNVNPTPHHHPSTETPSSLNNDLYQQQIDNVNPTPHHHPSTETPSSLPDAVLSNDPYQQQIDNVNPTPYNPYDDAPSNTPLPPQYNNANHESSTPATEIPQYDYYDQQVTGYAPSDYIEYEVVTENPIDSHHDQSSVGYGTVEPILVVTTPEPPKSVEDEPKALPSLATPFNEDSEIKENKGLFATIMGTVNNMLSSNKKAKLDEQDDLHKILYSSADSGHKIQNKNEGNKIQYCEKLGPNGDCPHSEPKVQQPIDDCECSFTKSFFNADLTFDTFAQALASKVLEISELLAFLAIVAAASLFFIFGYYCFCNSSREGALLSKLNQLESSLLATHKENAILKHNLMSTRQKLASIEDNSFGSNDMVVSLKTELEEELVEKARLQEQITNLQKELENAADAGIELNKIVSELLSNQTGDESIISSVEELQKQLNEQQNTILEINASLAEKSRENSELQLLIAEQNARYESEIANLQRDNDELEQEKGNLQTRLEEIRNDFDKDITVALEGKNFEIKRLQNEIVELSNKIDSEHTKWQTSMAKVEALEECLRNVKRDPNVNITQVIDVANIRAELLDAQKKYTTIKERLETQLDSRKLAENQLQIVTVEVEKLKQDFNQSEKDKLEAQTRLEVLSNYFKDKENQLQKELSLKEAMWLKQQGETTTTVDRLTAMKEEIQALKSQNDSLRAEIEAQVAAHKAQTGTLENRAHETWLAARQSDRRYEEARAEATALRRKLTALAGGNVNEANKPSAGSAGLGDELTNAPSPIHMESPGSPMLGRMPPPPFLPPPFMGPPPPFMGMPPPPFVTPGEMRPAPLGRIMSPPPQRSSRFSPPRLDYEDYLDYEGNNTWHRHTYSPPPRTYRSLSPTDSRYDYENERDLMSIYDTEADFSPPPSPRESRRRGFGGGNATERANNNTRSPYNNSKKSNSGNKGPLSSGSEKSYNSSSHHGGKAKGGNSGVGKSLV